MRPGGSPSAGGGNQTGIPGISDWFDQAGNAFGPKGGNPDLGNPGQSSGTEVAELVGTSLVVSADLEVPLLRERNAPDSSTGVRYNIYSYVAPFINGAYQKGFTTFTSINSGYYAILSWPEMRFEGDAKPQEEVRILRKGSYPVLTSRKEARGSYSSEFPLRFFDSNYAPRIIVKLRDQPFTLTIHNGAFSNEIITRRDEINQVFGSSGITLQRN